MFETIIKESCFPKIYISRYAEIFKIKKKNPKRINYKTILKCVGRKILVEDINLKSLKKW